MTVILAGEFDCDTQFVTLAVFVSTAASLVTLTLLLTWLI
jgi:predicted permease